MMIKTKEKMLLSVEEQEKEEGEEKKEEEEEVEERQEICNDDEKKSTVGGEKEVEELPQATDEKIPSPVQSVKKKQQGNVLILNNEVVKMRKEVKRIRVLIIRKMLRQVAVLKKNKGKETEIEKNQRRAARLLEEVQCMKNLKPDLVTKTALQTSLNFEQVCKNPKSTLSDRAIARIATHPQFNKQIESIKAAVKAFKEERVKGGKPGGKAKVQKQPEKETVLSPKKKVERKKKKNKEDRSVEGRLNKEDRSVEGRLNKEDRSVERQEITDNEKVEDALKDNEAATAANSQTEMEKDHLVDVHVQEMSKCTNAKPVSVKHRDAKDFVKLKPQSTALSVPAALKKRADDDESDVESSDNEEREYFDDSTEERFHKQSSQSEESDDDDFFIGKVTKFKKKKKDSEGEKSVDKAGDVKRDPKGNEETSDKLQSELDDLEARLKPKATGFQSVFCSSLGGSKSGGGIGRGRGGGKFRGQGKLKRDVGPEQHLSNQPKFKSHEKGTSESKFSQACPESERPDRAGNGCASGGRGRGRGRGTGRGRGGVRGAKDHRGGGVFSHQAPQPALHPSWEASKRRKEQQGQILAFQGKKIKFDDDD